MISWIENVARKILAKEISVKDSMIQDGLQRVYELEKRIKALGPGESLYMYLVENIDEWTKIQGLVNTGAMKSLAVFMAQEVEESEQDVARGNEHQFWYYQGCKSILLKLMAFEKTANEKILYYSKRESEVPESAEAELGPMTNYQ